MAQAQDSVEGNWEIQLVLEQLGFELHGSTYTRIFVSKYSSINVLYNFLFSSVFYCKNTVYNIYNIQNMY